MALTRLRFLSRLLTVVLVFPFPSAAFDTPLSDTAVREAYFMGQRHDETLARFFDKYTKHLPPPKTGPYVSSIAFFTPFALAVELSSQQASGYSAQQAQIDHRNREESVRIVIQIEFTDSYGALIARPTSSRSGAPIGYALRPYTFWKDFDVQVFDQDSALKPFSSSAKPNYLCSADGGCTLTGATLSFEFLAEAFTTGTAIVQVIPPEGDHVTLEFDLSFFR
jgi:hypothetical protein